MEFPKCLFLGGEWEGDCKIANDADHEEELRDAGYMSIGEGPVPSDDTTDLVAEAESLGIKVDKRWGAARLAEEIEKAKGQ